MNKALYQKAFVGGILGGAVMSILMVFARRMDLTTMNLAVMLGSMITREVDTPTYVIGLVIHFLASGAIGLAYAWIFDVWGRAAWWAGALIAIPHTVVGGLFLYVTPWMHPAIPEHEALIAPGFAAIHYGWMTAVAFVLLHLIYGAIVGGIAQIPSKQFPPDADDAGRPEMIHDVNT